MKTGILAFLILAGAAFAQENYSDWEYSRSIVLNTTGAGAGVTGAVTQFPLLVRLTPAHSEVFGNTKFKGADIRFTKSDGATRLKHQIERWDTVNQVADIWVLMDTVFASGYTTLTMYWSNPAAADSSRGSQVFGAGSGFAAVWHMGDAPGAAARPNASAASPTTNAAAPSGHSGLIALNPVQGVIGLADSLRGNGTGTGFVGDHFNLGSGLATLGDYGAVTLSMWVKPASFGATNSVKLMALGNSGPQNLLWIGRHASSGNKLAGNSAATTGAGSTLQAASGTLVPDAWQHVAYTVNNASDTHTLYVNGVQVAQNSGAQDVSDVSRSLNYIGRSLTASDSTFRGVVDEVSLATTARSANWLKLTYETQRPAPTTVTIGPALPRNFAARRITATDFVSTPRWEIPDYVFDPAYKLRSLAETEEYVRVHRHLPDIPSAAHIAGKGLDLGEMNLRLLKTVEELTLHAIDLDKRNRALEDAVKDLSTDSDPVPSEEAGKP